MGWSWWNCILYRELGSILSLTAPLWMRLTSHVNLNMESIFINWAWDVAKSSIISIHAATYCDCFWQLATRHHVELLILPSFRVVVKAWNQSSNKLILFLQNYLGPLLGLNIPIASMLNNIASIWSLKLDGSLPYFMREILQLFSVAWDVGLLPISRSHSFDWFICSCADSFWQY